MISDNQELGPIQLPSTNYWKKGLYTDRQTDGRTDRRTDNASI